MTVSVSPQSLPKYTTNARFHCNAWRCLNYTLNTHSAKATVSLGGCPQLRLQIKPMFCGLNEIVDTSFFDVFLVECLFWCMKPHIEKKNPVSPVAHVKESVSFSFTAAPCLWFDREIHQEAKNIIGVLRGCRQASVSTDKITLEAQTPEGGSLVL